MPRPKFSEIRQDINGGTWLTKYSIILETLSHPTWPPVAALAGCRHVGPVPSLPGLWGFKMAPDMSVWMQLSPVLMKIGIGLRQGWCWRGGDIQFFGTVIPCHCIGIIRKILSLCDIPWQEALVRSKAATHKYVLTDSYFVVLRFWGGLLALVCITGLRE